MDTSRKPPVIRSIVKFVVVVGIAAYAAFRVWSIPSSELGEMIKTAFSYLLAFGGAGIGALVARESFSFPAPSWKLLAVTVAGAGICGWLVLVVVRFVLSIIFKLGVIIGAVFCVIALGAVALAFASASLGSILSNQKLAEQAIDEGGSAQNISHLVNTDTRYSALRSGDGRSAYERERAKRGIPDDR